DAHMKVWGCQATHAYRSLIRAAAHAKDPKEKIVVDWEGTRLETTAQKAKAFLRNDILPSSYMARAAAVLDPGVRIAGAPPGVDSRYRRVRVGDQVRDYMFVKT